MEFHCKATVQLSVPQGATVRKVGERILIGRVIYGGLAQQTGLLHAGEYTGVTVRACYWFR